MSLDIRPNPSASGSTPTGGLTYKGSYDAALQSPNLDSSLKGDFYIVSDAGSLAGVALNIGDHIVFNQDASSPITSAMFDVIDNTDAVASVNTQTGVVVLDTDDISEGSNLYFTSGRAYVAADARIGAADLTDLNDVSYTAGPGIDNFVLTYDNASNSWGAEASGAAPVSSVNTQTGAVVLDSDDIAEGTTNLYYTNARFDTQLATKDTGDLAEGSNLYYTNARFDTQFGTKDTDDVSEGTTNLYYTNARFDTQFGTKDTDDVSEGSNLYYTNARSDARIAAANLTDLNDVNYTAGAGIDNYILTYNHANTRWEAEVPATAPVSSVNTQTGAVVLDSDDVAEGTSNLYYTNARFDTQLATKDTDNLSEGTTNLYYTNARFDTQLATKDTGDLPEGSNLYYTNARSDARIGAADLTDLNDVNYTAGAGIDNYVLTYNHANTRWEAEVPATAPVSSVNTQTGAVVLDSDDIAEGTTNLYYTNARFDTRFDTQLGTKDTGDLAEGSNLYYTNARFDTQLATKDSDDVGEGTTNLYYTNARADARIGAANLTDLNDVNYTAGAGIDNYVLTYNHANTRWEAEVPATAPVSSVNTQTGAVVLDSDDIAEGTSNLYYTNARFDTRFDTQLATKDTDNLSEGTSNLYYTNARFDTQLATKDSDDVAEGTTNLYYTNARFDTQLGTKDTGDLSEGSNLYYTNARADARIAAANLTDLNDVSYTAGAGIDNYVLTYNHANTRWEAEAAAGGGGSAPDTTTVSQGTDYTISTSTGIEEAFFITPTADINVNLPSAVTVGEGYKYNIKNLASGFSLTVDANGTQTIDTSLTYVINNQFQSITIMSDGANWFII